MIISYFLLVVFFELGQIITKVQLMYYRAGYFEVILMYILIGFHSYLKLVFFLMSFGWIRDRIQLDNKGFVTYFITGIFYACLLIIFTVFYYLDGTYYNIFTMDYKQYFTNNEVYGNYTVFVGFVPIALVVDWYFRKQDSNS